MLNRRAFIKMSGMTGAASLGALGATGRETGKKREYYALRRYHVETDAQRAGLAQFLGEAAIPAWNRLGISPVGAFVHAEEGSPVYVLLPHQSPEALLTATHALLNDGEFLDAGAAFLNAPASAPAYKRMEIAYLLAFTGMPALERPSTAKGRVFQLRTYESPSVKTGQKKIEMFNTAELAIFRKVGLTPVFFGEALAGDKMPNLTYMLGFDSMDAQKAAWDRFLQDPDWKELSAKPEYANDAILCGITNLPLRPLACSQI